MLIVSHASVVSDELKRLDVRLIVVLVVVCSLWLEVKTLISHGSLYVFPDGRVSILAGFGRLWA